MGYDDRPKKSEDDYWMDTRPPRTLGHSDDHWIRVFGGYPVTNPNKFDKIRSYGPSAPFASVARVISGRGFFADGGIVGGMDPEMMPPEDEELSGLPMEQMQSIPLEELRSIVIEAKQALDGTHPNPEAAIEIFIQVFGEQELASLKDAVIQEMEGGPAAIPEEGDPSLMSDGLSDSIPASIDGMEPAALSEGEYVVPADAVSGLGNGDTDSGARRLEEMVGKIRSVRGGMPQAPPAMDPMSVMPPEAGGYARGGEVSGGGRSALFRLLGLDEDGYSAGLKGGGPVKSFRYAHGGVVSSDTASNPSLSSSLFNLGRMPSPVSVMDPYPGGGFQTPVFVPPVIDPFVYSGAGETAAEKSARRIADRQARQAARSARPIARREQRRDAAQYRFDLRNRRALDRILHRKERAAARQLAAGGIVSPAASPSFSSGLFNVAQSGLGSRGFGNAGTSNPSLNMMNPYAGGGGFQGTAVTPPPVVQNDGSFRYRSLDDLEAAEMAKQNLYYMAVTDTSRGARNPTWVSGQRVPPKSEGSIHLNTIRNRSNMNDPRMTMYRYHPKPFDDFGTD